MGSYIEFIETVSQNRELAQEFKQSLKSYTMDELSTWFNNKGFNVSSAECGIIMKNTKLNFLSTTVMGAY
jgi:hypothetical protein